MALSHVSLNVCMHQTVVYIISNYGNIDILSEFFYDCDCDLHQFIIEVDPKLTPLLLDFLPRLLSDLSIKMVLLGITEVDHSFSDYSQSILKFITS